MANPPINPKNKRINESEQETKNLAKHNLKELQLLSVLADNRKGLLEVSSIVKPEDFETNEYRETYIAFLNNDKDLDDYLRNIIDYQEQQRTRELQRSTGQTLKDYAKKVKEHSVRRKVNSVLRRARHKVLNTDSEMLLSSLQSNLFSISGEVTGERICSSKDIVKKAITEMNDFSKEKKKIELPSNFSNLGDIVKGIFPHHVWIIGGHSGTGKCLKKGTKILMFDGSIKKVEQIKVGDKLMGDDSKLRNVLNLCHGKEMMYKIIPIKGESFTVNASHILSLKRTGSTYDNRKNEIININIKDYLKTSKYFKTRYKLWRTGVKFKKQKIKINPYLLGLWLGDGSSHNTGITTSDNEIVKIIYQQAKKLNLKVTINQNKDKTCPTYIITTGYCGSKTNKNILLNNLKEYNLIKNKHIPQQYKINSRKNRLQLLAGLIDSDGERTSNCLIFSNINKKLAEDVLFLARSLGFAAYLKKYTAKIKKINYSVKAYKVQISGDLSIIPILLKRKQCTKRKQKKNVLVTGFKIKKIGISDYYGFNLNDNHLYLLNDFTVTHNSFFTLQLISDLMLSSGDKENPSNLKIVIFSTENNATDNLFRIVGCRTGIPFIDIKTNNLSENDKVRVNKQFEILKKTSLWIYDNVYDVTQLASIVALHKFRNECDLVVIDYIQNLNMWEKDSYVQMNKVAMTLQQMALTNDVATICVSQLSNTESRESGDKMITFKGAGEIKAIADVGIWLQKGISENIKNKYKEQYGEGIGNPLMETRASASNMLRYVEKENEDLITAYVNKVRHAMPGTAIFEFFTNQCLTERHQYLNKIDFKISDEDAPDLANALG